MPKTKKDDRHAEVYWSEWHHGDHAPERPWCYIVRSTPGAVPGEPRDGIRYMESFPTREQAVRKVAEERAWRTPRSRRAQARAEAVYKSELERMLEEVDREAPTGPPTT